LNRAFEVAGAQSFIRGKIVDLLSVLGVMVLVGLSIAATAALGLFRQVVDAESTGVPATVMWGLVYFVVSFGLSFATFLVAYRLIPNVRIGWSTLWIGAFIAAVGLELAKAGFGLYITTFGRSQEVYGGWAARSCSCSSYSWLPTLRFSQPRSQPYSSRTESERHRLRLRALDARHSRADAGAAADQRLSPTCHRRGSAATAL
jgi:hypothetical protein